MNPTLYATRDDGAQLWDTGVPTAFPGEPGYGYIIADGKVHDPRPILALTAQGSWTLADGVEAKRDYVRDANGEFASTPGSSRVSAHNILDFITNAPSSPTPVNLSGVRITGSKHPDVFTRNLGVPREQMPQVPNTHKASFLNELRGEGVSIEHRQFDPLDLHPVQSEIDARRVAEFFPLDPMLTEQNPILVSSDGFVLDGHHRWAASAAESAHHPGRVISAVQVDLPIKALLARAEKFNTDQAIVGRAFGDKAAFALPEEKAAVIDAYWADDPEAKRAHHAIQHHGGWLWAGRASGPDSGAAREAVRSAADAIKGKPDIIEVVDPFGDKIQLTAKTDSMWHNLERKPDGSWGFTEERERLHRKIIQDALRGVPRSENPTLHMLGGGPAAGKSTMLEKGHTSVPTTGENGSARLAVMVNADAVKEQIPEYSDSSLPDPAGFSHEESSWVAKQIQAAAIAGQRDIVLDGTGDSKKEKLTAKIMQARTAGYRVEGHYATVPTQMAVDRVEQRAKELEAQGRVPRRVREDVVRGTHASISRVVPQTHDLFDEFTLYDTTNGARLIAHGSRGTPLTIEDQRAYADFLAKGKE
jgi:predicted ABC-type ATPase